MDLNAARMFVSVAQTGSLSAAANDLGIPLATLSRRIRQLERQLNIQLLERSVRGAQLTDAGAQFYQHASLGIQALSDGALAVASGQARLEGRLRLSLPPVFEPWWALLTDFQRRYPGIHVQVHTTERRVDLIEDGIDVALRVGAIAHDAMVARHLLTYRHVLVASPELIERLGQPATPHDLQRYPCATWRSKDNAQSVWRLGDQSIEPSGQLSTNDYAHLRDCALYGELVTELPPFLASQALREGRLLALLPAYPLPEQQINLLYPSHRHPSAIVRAYLDYCSQHAATYITQPARNSLASP